MKIYLDVCCLNRPFDDQTQGRIRIESEAVLVILDHVETGGLELVGSDTVLYEIRRIPDPARRRGVELLSGAVGREIKVDDSIVKRAAAIERLGILGLDAVHVACAESASVAVMLTTDDQLIRIATRLAKQLGVPVRNPVQFLTMEASS